MIQVKTDGVPAVFYHETNFLPENLRRRVLDYLESTQFRGGENSNGKDIPRRQLWFQRDNRYFCEKWYNRFPRWESNTYTEVLDELENFVQDKINILLKNKDTNIPHLNSILINKYRDGKDSIRPHRDSSVSFGEEPTIIVISLGSTRDLVFKKNGSDKSEFKFTMADNSFFIMGGGSQKYFTHEIPKTDACGTRYSLTMREYINH